MFVLPGHAGGSKTGGSEHWRSCDAELGVLVRQNVSILAPYFRSVSDNVIEAYYLSLRTKYAHGGVHMI